MHNTYLVLFPEFYLTGGVSYSESDGDNRDVNADDSQEDANHAGNTIVIITHGLQR
jgi:outer membrane protein TolC